MNEPLAFLNGQFLPQSDARLPFHDAGLVFGATATDLCRTFHHQLFRLADHLARFRQSCRLIQVPQPLPDEELTGIAEDLVSRNARLLRPEEDLALVMFATPGPIGYYGGQEGGPGDGLPTLAMHTFPLPFHRYVSFFQKGIHLVTPSIRRVPGAFVDPRAKQRSRLHWWLAEREARQRERGAAALLLDNNGGVTETAGANFLIVQGGTVLSPPRQSILGGISLQMVQDLCGELGLGFEEKVLGLDECLGAEEALLTSTPYCVAGVSRINDTALPWPGQVWQQLLKAWSAHVGLDIQGQILQAGDLS